MIKRLFPLFAVPLLAAGCIDLTTSGPAVVTMETADITSSSARINIVLSGDMPSNCRMTKAFLIEDVDASTYSEAMIYNVSQVEGHEISLPCTETLEGLSPYKEYNVMMSYEAGGEKRGTYVRFTTLADSGGVLLFLSNPSCDWTSDDVAGLFSYDREETSNVNVKLSPNEYYLNQKSSLFQPEKTLQIPSVGTDRFIIYYPYDESVVLSTADYAVHSTLASSQSCDPSAVFAPESFLWGIKELGSSTARLDYELTDALGTVEFEVSTADYPGYAVKSVTLFDYDGDAALSGEFAIDPDKELVKAVAGKTESSVAVSRAEDAGDGNLRLSIIPGDYSGSDLRIFVELSSESGGNVIVPMRYPGSLNIGQGEKMVCKITELVPDSAAYPWYEPVEARDYLDKCAYGPSNTFCIECKAAGTSEIEFSVKARGNILEAKTPKYYGILLPSNIKDGKLLRLPDGVDAYEETPTREIPSDYKVKVGCYGQDQAAGYWGVVAIYDKDYNILWSYMIWRYNAGDPVSEVAYTDFTLMDRALGACKGVSKAVADGSIGEGVAYFEWGRKDPFPWYDQVPDYYVKASPSSGVGIDYSVAHPNVWLTYSSTKAWFFTAQRKDLWGNENTTTSNNTSIVGHKTIYDPCPDGWRVCDYSVCDYVYKNKVFAERAAASGDKRYKIQNKLKSTHLAVKSPYSDMSVVKVDCGNGTTDYWPYYGLMWGSTNAWANKSGNATDYAYAYWSNSNQSSSNDKASVLIGYYTSSAWTATTSMVMADAYAVRCQKDTK